MWNVKQLKYDENLYSLVKQAAARVGTDSGAEKDKYSISFCLKYLWQAGMKGTLIGEDL